MDWLPEPDGETIFEYGFQMRRLRSIRTSIDSLSGYDEDDETLAWGFEPVQIDPLDIPVNVYFQTTNVGVVERDRENITSDYLDEGFVNDTTYRGFSLLEQPGNRFRGAVGVGDELVVHPLGIVEDVPQRRVVTSIIDTVEGEHPLRVDEDEPFGGLIEELGDGDLVSGTLREPDDEHDPARGQLANVVASGRTATIDGKTTRGKWVFRFDRPANADTRDLRVYFESRRRAGGLFNLDGITPAWKLTDVSQRGATGVIRAVANTRDL